MRRKAIIVGAPLSKENPDYMPGAEIDVLSYANFLTSPIGGCWLPDSEVVSMINPTSKALREEIESVDVDYSMVVYTGHGGTDDFGNTLLQINDEEVIPLSYTTTYSSRQLAIVDACRDHIPCEYSHFTGYQPVYFESSMNPRQARSIFDARLYSSSPGVAVLYSTSRGTSAYGNEEGGFFSRFLMNAIKNWSSSVRLNDTLTLSNVTHVTQKALSGTQVPELVRSSLVVDFPVAIRRAYSGWL